jgi:hypothetical protein
MLAIDRNLSGFDFTGLLENINCFVLTSPDTGARSAKWRKGSCHGANTGIVALSDGSVSQLTIPVLSEQSSITTPLQRPMMELCNFIFPERCAAES